MNCKNCGEKVERQFCGHCGQKSNIDRINLSNFLNEVSESVFQINRGLLFTLKELLVRPGDSIRDFINGKRKKHFKPIAYVLTFSTLYFLISSLAGENTWMNDLISGFSNASSDIGSTMEIPPVLTWLGKNFAYATLLLIPIFSLASYVSFLGLGTNYLEHIVINSYITGQQAIFYSVFIIIKLFFDSKILEAIPVLFSVSYAFWAYWQFFSKENGIMIILRSIITYILYLMFSIGLLFFLIVI
ncbi:MAG: DUF3667 domain-containing protein [Flavobacteriaceae bacterium]